MPPPQIAIEIAAAESVARPGNRPGGSVGASDERATLLAACTAAAATAECVLANSETKAEVLALVFWREAGRVRVEVGSASRKGPWATRDIEFGARDPVIERWRTAGYTVGLLAAEALTSEQQPSVADKGPASSRDQPSAETRAQGQPGTTTDSSSTAETTKNNAPAKVASPPEADKPRAETSDANEVAEATQARDSGHRVAVPYRWSFAGGGSVGQGLESLRAGGFLRASRAFAGPFATAALAYSVDTGGSQDISAQWFTLSAGAGYEVTTPWFALDLRGELIAERLATGIDDPVSGRTDSQSRWVAGLCVGAELARDIAGPIGVLVGIESTVRTNRTDVQVGNTVRADAPAVSGLALLGVRATLR